MQQVIEFIGAEEEEDIKCAWGIRHLFGSVGEITDYTHCELGGWSTYFVDTGLIAYAGAGKATTLITPPDI
jgi:DNA-directed RNA polymerase IV and V subunit 2